MRQNVLITGKNGFIGKNILGGKEFIGRLEDLEALLDQSQNVNGIVHLAGKSNKRKCSLNPKACIESNLIGLCNVLETALKNNLWVLFISSYQIKEPTLYGLSKLLGEELCREYKRKGVNVKILRLPIVYGEGDSEDKIVTKFIKEIRNGKEPKIETAENFYFLYIQDAIRLIESEVEILNGNLGEPYILTDLIEGIKKCLNFGK